MAEIPPVTTSHGCGEKHVLLSRKDTQTAITQIAITAMRKGEDSGMHRHPTMEESFLIRKGTLRISFEEGCIVAVADDFVTIPADTPHRVEAVTDVEMLTIGCAL